MTDIQATILDGHVWLKVDPATARSLASAWEFAHTQPGGFDPRRRPVYLSESGLIRSAASYAERQATTPEPAQVPLLRVVGGDGS
jgi:hypothetical protein